VTQVTPAGTKPQTEVGDQLREMWLAEKRSAAVEKQAKELAAKVGEGKSLAEVAKENGLETKTSEPFLRNAQGASGLPSNLIGAIFEAKPNVAVTAAGPGGWYVAQLKNVERPDPSADPAALDQLERQLGAQLRDDLVSEYQRGLRSRFPVEIHREEIDRFL
jgi:peptidyl-prolyl cis-trans isomerase D